MNFMMEQVELHQMIGFSLHNVLYATRGMHGILMNVCFQ
jgi:hypothetical protein